MTSYLVEDVITYFDPELLEIMASCSDISDPEEIRIQLSNLTPKQLIRLNDLGIITMGRIWQTYQPTDSFSGIAQAAQKRVAQLEKPSIFYDESLIQTKQRLVRKYLPRPLLRSPLFDEINDLIGIHLVVDLTVQILSGRRPTLMRGKTMSRLKTDLLIKSVYYRITRQPGAPISDSKKAHATVEKNY